MLCTVFEKRTKCIIQIKDDDFFIALFEHKRSSLRSKCCKVRLFVVIFQHCGMLCCPTLLILCRKVGNW